MIGVRRVVSFSDLIDIKTKFNLRVGGWLLVIGDDRPVLLRKLGIHQRNRKVGRQTMPFGVGGVVRKSAQSKRIFIQIARLGDERENKIAAPNIVREITKESATEG